MQQTLRHIRTRLHRIQKAVRDGLVGVRWIPASDQLADVLSKVVPVAQFVARRSRFMSGTAGPSV